MKIQQLEYCSPRAMQLRRRDGTPPWGAHVCEVDDLAHVDEKLQPVFAVEVERARQLRKALETPKGD